MDIFDMEFPELPSIAPDLMFEEEPLPVKHVFTPSLTSLDRETLLNFVFDDHAYAKPYPILSTANNKCVTPQTILKLHPTDAPTKKKYKRNQSKYQSHGSEDDEEIDVVTVAKPADFVVKYDKTKAHNGMNEVESYLNSLWKDVDKDDDEKIMRGSWSKEQARLFDCVYKLINNYQLAKLAYVKNSNEPVLRKLALDKATHRIRKAFGSVLWNPKYIVWLHGVMIDGLGSSLFLCYLEILQSLKRKAPILFERVLLFDRAASEKELTAGLPNLGVRLKKSWDPSTGLQTKVTVEKFPTTPFLIMVPSGPNIPHQSTKRNRFWNNQLMNFGKVFPINVPAYRTLEGYVIKHYLEHCISAIRSKITEFRNRFPERHVVLVGWGVGSLISLKVANLYKVDAIVCLGFPCNGIDGDASEEYWKGLTKIECPVLFVLGTHATSNSIAATEKLREQMKTQTNLLLIESADEMLRLTKSQKKTLGMTQNMIDKLIQDEIYLFLKSVLFTPKPVISHLPKGPVTGKKRKKKVDSAEKGETKKKKKAHVKPSSLLAKSSDALLLPPLDVSISSVSSIPLGISQGLLTTGSVSTSIPVTQLQSESLTTMTSTVLQQTVSTDDVIVSTTKEVPKRNIIKEPKEKIRKTKSSRKSSVAKNIGMPPGPQKFSTISNPNDQQFPVSEMRSNKSTIQQPVAFQRVPAGSFVLSGASGQIRLQGGANILYLQQATSGATQLLSTPVINTSTGAFTAVISSNLVVSNPPKINIVPSSNFKFGPPNPTLTQQNKGLSAIISSGGCGNLVITSTSSPTTDSAVSSSVDTLSGGVSTSSTPTSSNTCTTAPPTVASGSSVTTTSSSTIMTHLSANDLRYLANLIAKHSNSRPNSPMPSSVSGPLLFKTDDKVLLKTSRENTDTSKAPVSSTSVSEGGISVNKSSLISILDKKVTLAAPNQTTKKVVQPPSLAQRVASIQQKDPTKMKNPRLKTSKLVSTTINMPMGHIITANATKNNSLPANSKVLHKVPVTLTIPISRLPSNLNFSSNSVLSKSIINVPVLSSYLSQEKFVPTSSKPTGSSSSSRTIVTNPAVAKKSPIMIGNVPVSSSPVKMSNMTVFPSSRAPTPSSSRTNASSIFITKTPFSSTISPFKSPSKGKNPSPITLHLPSQATLKDPKVLRKAVSDVKVVGVLSQQSKSQIPSLVNLSALRSISNPSSPLRSPSNDSLHGEMMPGELSPIQPREPSDVSDLKTEDRKKNSFSPLKSSIMAAIGDNVKPLTPPNIPSSSLLAASVPRDINVLGRGNIPGKVGTGAFLGKLFVGPKSIIDPMRGKVSFSSKDPNISSHVVGSFGHHMAVDPYEDDDDEDEDDDEDDESDVDFAISPAVDSPNTNTPVNKPVIFDPIKHSNITKIVYAPTNSSENKYNLATPSNVFSKNILDIARAKLRETQFRCANDGLASPNMGVGTPSSQSDATTLEEQVALGANDSKLRFEPLKSSTTRAKLTSVLSMRDNKADDIKSINILQNANISIVSSSVVDSKISFSDTFPKDAENSSNIVTIHSSRPLAASSSVKYITSSRHAPITNFTLLCDPESNRGVAERSRDETENDSILSSEERGMRNIDVKYSSVSSNGVTAHDSKELHLSDSKVTSFVSIDGKRTSIATLSYRGTTLSSSKIKGIPFANIESKGIPFSTIGNRGMPFSSIENKALPLSSIETKVTPLNNVYTNPTSQCGSPQISKLLGKPAKSSKSVQEYKMIVEEEPQPYITRSGRVMRSKYSIQYIDELDRKKTPKKRRLSTPTTQDSLQIKKSKISSEASQTSTVTLENLVEAAKLITKESDSLVNGKGTVMTETGVNHVNNLSEIDPTTNIAATAMLELLSGDTKSVKDVRNIDGMVMEGVVTNNGNDDHDSVENTCNDSAKHEIPISNGVSHESTELSLFSKDVNVVMTPINENPSVPNVNSILRNPSDPSLPSLAPILKVSTDIQNIPSNLEQLPVKDSSEATSDIADRVSAGSPGESTCPSPIPPLAAIQDKCSESELGLSVELLDPMKRNEIKEMLPMGDSKMEISSDQYNPLPFTTIEDKNHQLLISSTEEGLTEPIPQVENMNNFDSNEHLPTLAVIQDKSTPENSVVASSSLIQHEHTKTPSPVTVTTCDVFKACIPVTHEQNNTCSSEFDRFENEIVTDECVKTVSTELTPCSNLSVRLPSSSPPALAVIQSKPHGNAKFNESNIIAGGDYPNSIDDMTIVNSLPPLAAIQINSTESENSDLPNSDKLNSSESDLHLIRETNKNIELEREDLVLPAASLAQSGDTSQSIHCSSAITEKDEMVYSERNDDSEEKLSDEQKKEVAEG